MGAARLSVDSVDLGANFSGKLHLPRPTTKKSRSPSGESGFFL
jgi:hypothetical protein